jgi:hypothetical protein
LYKQWEFVLDKIKPKDRSITWDSPIVIQADQQHEAMPRDLPNEQFVEWLYLNILKYPQVDPAGANMWLNHLHQGVTQEQLYQHFVGLVGQQNQADNDRQKIRARVDKVQKYETNAVIQEMI